MTDPHKAAREALAKIVAIEGVPNGPWWAMWAEGDDQPCEIHYADAMRVCLLCSNGPAEQIGEHIAACDPTTMRAIAAYVADLEKERHKLRAHVAALQAAATEEREANLWAAFNEGHVSDGDGLWHHQCMSDAEQLCRDLRLDLDKRHNAAHIVSSIPQLAQSDFEDTATLSTAHDNRIRTEERERCAHFVETHTLSNTPNGNRIIEVRNESADQLKMAAAIRAMGDSDE